MIRPTMLLIRVAGFCVLLAVSNSMLGCSRGTSSSRTGNTQQGKPSADDSSAAQEQGDVIPGQGDLNAIFTYSEPVTLPVPSREPNELESLIIGLLHEQDKDVRSLAFEQIRGNQAQGEEATRIFAAELPKLDLEAQASLISALAERGDAAALPWFRNLIANNVGTPELVRLAAITALGKLGHASDVPRLVHLLLEGTADEQAEARKSLAQLSGTEASEAIIGLLSRVNVPARITLMEILGERRATEAIPAMLSAATSENAGLRAVAMSLLGQFAGPEHLPTMVRGVLKATRGKERAAAERAIQYVCQRTEVSEGRTAPLLDAVQNLNKSDRLIMMPTLGRVGGQASLAVIEAAIPDPDEKLHDAGIRALCNWPSAAVATQLIKLAMNDQHADHRTMTMRALIRISPLPDGRSDEERLALTKRVMEICTDDDQRKLVLQRASAIRTPETLRYVLAYVDHAALSEAACLAVVELAHHRGLREPNKAEFDTALDKVIDTSKDEVVVERANRYKRGQTWVRPSS